MSDPLKIRLKHLIVETLHLEDKKPEDIADAEPLMGSGLALDSIDALELAVSLEKNFGVATPSAEVAREAFVSVNTIASYVTAKQQS